MTSHFPTVRQAALTAWTLTVSGIAFAAPSLSVELPRRTFQGGEVVPVQVTLLADKSRPPGCHVTVSLGRLEHATTLIPDDDRLVWKRVSRFARCGSGKGS